MRERTPRPKADVCVVGAGVAGGLVGYKLARHGYDVVFLEAGKRFDPSKRLDRMEVAIRPEHQLKEVWDMGGERDRYSISGEMDYALNRLRVKGVGGTTLHWLGNTPRLHERDFEMESRYGIATDWPFGYHDLQPYYAEAERELGVAGTDSSSAPPREEPYPLKPFPKSHSDGILEEACENLGISVRHCPQARNSEAYDGRSQCVGYSTCSPVCPSGAKYSGDVHIRKAETEGAAVLDRVPVEELEHDGEGNVTAARYVAPDGERYRQEARHFVLACGGVETPRLLLMSKSTEYPDGLANTSGAVGRYFMDHPTIRTTGRLDRETNPEPIAFMTMTSEQFYDVGDSPPGSILLEFANTRPPSPMSTAMHGGITEAGVGADWGDEIIGKQDSSNDQIRVGALTEMLPRKENRVKLDTENTDNHGNPVPDLSFSLGPYERETFEHAFDIQEQILKAAGAEITGRTDTSYPEFFSHLMGTTRMGNDPDGSVVNERLQSHDLDNLWIVGSSVFPTGGAANPTLTIAALSLKAAVHMDGVL